MKFGRVFSMLIEGASGDSYTVSSPLTCKLRVSNAGTASASKAVFEIFNLTQDVRNDIYADPFKTSLYRQISFAAGYQSQPSIPIIFHGNVYRAYSHRQGPDWVTHIECLDGGYAIENGFISLSMPTPYNFEDAIKKLVAGMPHVKLGVLGAFEFTSTRGIVYSGNPWDLLIRQILPLQGQLYIDREVVNIVQQREYIANSSGFDTISQDTGLLDTPKKQDGQIHCRMIFEPRAEIMQKITVNSLQAVNNGDFKVMQIDHYGTISGAVCEDLITEITGFSPEFSLEQVA